MNSELRLTGLSFAPVFTGNLGKDPLDSCEWEFRNAVIKGANGNIVFEQKDVEVPKHWSQTATNIVASKYFHGILGTPERETSVRQVIQRVVNTITDWGKKDGYFDKLIDEMNFARELAYMLVWQIGAFNSPVWFNVGCDKYQPDYSNWNWHWDYLEQKIRYDNVGYTRPQCSACFINGVEDNMESIMDLAKTEVLLFKGGSGAGSNLSAIRSSKETLSGGGKASGPLSFMKGYDAFAGVIKSGGKTRRAAKMVILDCDHPDIEDFIVCKQKEEAKAWALVREGYDGSSPDSEAYASIFYQNANNSVRVSDEFMQQLIQDPESGWELKARSDGRVLKTVKARELMDRIAEATWKCGDPGMQFDTTINEWHTCPMTSRINASNPCSEYMFIDDSSCNLASLNLMMFWNSAEKTFNFNQYKQAVDIFITAQDIIVDNAGYPTEQIAKNSRDYRPLGLGFANLGTLLMVMGYAYDSDEGREVAANLTAIMTGEAYAQSARIAHAMPAIIPATKLCINEYEVQTGMCAVGDPSYKRNGAFPGYFLNKLPMLKVIRKHRDAVLQIAVTGTVPIIFGEVAWTTWNKALELGELYGYRNSQVTVLAPTGTIGFMLDVDTTGVEPMLGLKTFKKLVGGGQMSMTNSAVPLALHALGYQPDRIDLIVEHVAKTGTVEGSGFVKDAHLAVFDAAFKSPQGSRTISWKGHINMMSAVQPFLSGAISKTINMPTEATVGAIKEAYIYAWKKGVKAVAIYRDGSKTSQPVVMNTVEHQVHKILGPIPKENPELMAMLRKLNVQIIERPVEKAVEIVEKPLAEPVDLGAPPKATRHRLPDERPAINHKFSIAGHEGYINVGLYANGQPGEIFIKMAKEGSTISGVMDAFATVVSVALQHGVQLSTLIDKFAHMRFEPSGFTQNPDVKYAKSLMDYIFRWLEARFVKPKQEKLFAQEDITVEDNLSFVPVPTALSGDLEFGDAPICTVCGSMMVRNGSCYKCTECGGTSGCS